MTIPAKHCLLVIDDEQDVCDSIHDLLRRDYRVLKATTADDGYRLMQDNEVHIVLTDQRMPRISGVELLSNVRARHPQAIRMLFTGYADVEAVIAAINQGRIFRFLKKPWQPDELQSAIREAAIEFDRLVAEADERLRLRDEIKNLWQQLKALQEEVNRLKQARG